MRGVEPHEEGLAGLVLPRDEVFGRRYARFFARLQSLSRGRAGVFDLLLADAGPRRFLRRVILVLRKGSDHAARTEVLAEVGKVLFRWVVVHLRLFLGIEVIEVA